MSLLERFKRKHSQDAAVEPNTRKLLDATKIEEELKTNGVDVTTLVIGNTQGTIVVMPRTKAAVYRVLSELDLEIEQGTNATGGISLTFYH